MPIYNGAAYLSQAIESVLGQSFRNFELIIVDDCSQDDSIQIAEHYAKIDERVTVYRNKRNLGLVGNWNRSASHALGEWIKFLFQDDLLSPDCLQAFLAELGSNDMIAFCQRDLLFSEGTTDEARVYYLEHEKFMDKTFALGTKLDKEQVCEWALKHLGVNLFGEPTAMMIRRRVFFEFGPCNTELIMICDIEYALRIATNTGICLIRKRLATFRAHGGSSSAHATSSRQFRHRYLDHIIWLHDMLFAQHYASIREGAQRIKPAIRLDQLLTRRIFNAEQYIQRARASGSAEVQKMVDELRLTMARYPGAKLTSAIRLKWQLKKLYWALLSTEK